MRQLGWHGRGTMRHRVPAASRGQWPANQPDHELLERHGRDSMRVAGVDAGALRRVIPVGSSVDAAGVRVEFTVSDDAGTTYIASGQGSGGSSPGVSRHEVRFSPGPPEGAHVLVVDVASFVDPFPGRAVELDGPWEFRVEL